MICCQWAIVRLCHLCAHSKWRRRWLSVNRGFLVGLWARKQPDKSRLLVVFHPALFPCKFLICAFKPEHLRSDPIGPSWTKHGLYEVWSAEEPRGLAWHQSSGGSILLEDVVDGSTIQNHVPSNSTLQHALMGKYEHVMPNTYRGGTEHY